MAELTQEQVDRAGSILLTNWAEVCGTPYKAGCIYRIRAAAPFLQFPWDEPTRNEVLALGSRTGVPDQSVVACLTDFVRRRNAALVPKPADPRRIVLLKKLINFNVRDEQELDEEITAILTALDETASQSDDHAG